MYLSFIVTCLNLAFAGGIRLQTVEVEDFREGSPSVWETGEFSFLGKNRLFLFGRDGRLVNTFTTDGVVIESAAVFTEGVVISLETSNGAPETRLLDREGRQLAVIPRLYKQIVGIDGRYFGRPEYSLGKKDIPFPAQLELLDKERLASKNPIRFARLTDKQARLMANFKQVWPVVKGETLYLLNEIEPAVQVYSLESIFEPSAEYFSEPAQAPRIQLTLKKFREIESLFSPPVGMHPFREVSRLQENWWFSFSLIRGFHAYREGFVVSYSVPVCDEGQCFRHDLYVQRLDGAFKPGGEPQRLLGGTVIGVWQEQVYLFEPNYRFDASGEKTGMQPGVRILNDL